MHDEFHFSRDWFSKDITGEIVLSENPDQILKKWRGIFGFSQKKLATHIGITSSVISDYESGRRKSPGINFIKRYVNALLNLDMKRGGQVVKTFTTTARTGGFSRAIMDIKEFSSGIHIKDFCRSINANILTKKSSVDREIYGYTIIDSVKAIMQLSFNQLINLYGTTTQRALIFTGVSTGKTPMVAIKLTSLQPGLVVLHGIDRVDEVAMNISEAEGIPIALSKMDRIEDVIENLNRIV